MPDGVRQNGGSACGTDFEAWIVFFALFSAFVGAFLLGAGALAGIGALIIVGAVFFLPLGLLFALGVGLLFSEIAMSFLR